MQTLEEVPVTTNSNTIPPHAELVKLLFGKHLAYSLSAVAFLGVADHMSEYPTSVESLAGKVGAKADALYRVMRALAAAGVFEETSGRAFRLNEISEYLKSDTPGSVRYTAMQMGDPWSTRPWEHFTNIVRTGVDGVTQAFGKNAFELLAEEPEQADHFNRSMSGYSAVMQDAILAAYDFRCIRRLADIGGGHGKLLAGILGRYPHMTGVVYDLPEVIVGAYGQDHVADSGDRLSFEAGSFFERVPSGCDAYMMKFILHDWSDEHCKLILRRVREQMPDYGRVLVFEQIVNATPEMSFAKVLDLEMLALTVGGRERTEAEFAALFASAGLKLTAVFPTESPLCILEAHVDSESH
jgi:hypothetical protein